jgi:O-methyltransferase
MRQPARALARLAEWIGDQDLDDLRAAFRRAGFDLNQQQADHHYVNKYYGHNAQKLQSGLNDEAFMELAREVREDRRTFLYFNRLYTLYQAVNDVVRRFGGQQLFFLEAGVFRGGSAAFLGRLAANLTDDGVRIVAVDTFEGHSEEDIPDAPEGAHTPRTFRDVDVEDVRNYLAPVPAVEVLQGRIQDVAPRLAGDLQLIHADMDLYAPTRFVLDYAVQRLVPGGIVVVDDYGFVTCPGVQRAVDEFREEHGQQFVVHLLDSGQALLVRLG